MKLSVVFYPTHQSSELLQISLQPRDRKINTFPYSDVLSNDNEKMDERIELVKIIGMLDYLWKDLLFNSFVKLFSSANMKHKKSTKISFFF